MGRRQPGGTEPTTAARAFGWSFLNTVVGRLGTLAIGIALANLLGPDQFGTFAVATVALLAVLSFNELGVSLAIVRWQTDPREITPTVTTLSVAMSAVLTAVVWLVAPAFSAAMGNPGATSVVRLMAVSILINGLVAAPAAVLQREFMAKQRMLIDQVNTWLGAIVSLVLVLGHYGAISLAIGRVAGTAVSAVMFIRASPVPLRFGFDRRLAGALLRFGVPLAGSSVVVFAGGYTDQLTTGKLLGTDALAFYVLAFNLSSWPVTIFSQPLRAVAPAAFARQQHDPVRMNALFVTLLGLVAAVTVPACLGIAGASKAIVTLVYATVWAPAAPILLVLAVTAVVRIGFELSYDFLVVRGQSKAILWVQVIWVVVMIPVLVAGAKLGGTVGVAIGQLVVAVAVVVPAYLWLLVRAGLRVRALTRVVALPLLVGAAVAVGAYVLADQLTVTGDRLSGLLAGGLAGLLALGGIGLLALSQRSALRTFRDLRAAVDHADPAADPAAELARADLAHADLSQDDVAQDVATARRPA